MFGKKIRIEPWLYEQLERAASEKGYASVDEFAAHVLEKAAEGVDVDKHLGVTGEQLEGAILCSLPSDLNCTVIQQF